MPILQSFDGRDVIEAAIALRNAGDGLSQPMRLAPREMHHGDRGYLLVEYEVTDVHFPRIKLPKVGYTDDLRRVHVLSALSAMDVPAETGGVMFQDHKAALKKLRDEQEGKLSLNLDGDDDDADEFDDDDPAADVDDELDPPADPDDADWEASGRAEAPEPEPVAEEPPATDDVATARRLRWHE